ncbi:unnamed protein product [Mytilus edulis]|uniref:Reverse transcriptase domain-containing protein n=1 Tax=Mytilus edulis TaxID=6550 RepID=A0A8S3VM89_MYTED|nr:unnamed protein product [Mytilus edulis]
MLEPGHSRSSKKQAKSAMENGSHWIHIPALIKSGIVCPVFKSGGKPKDDPNSYRKITITSSVGKVVEKIHLSRNEDKILERQSNLQKGFTKGESPCIAVLIIAELIMEAKKRYSSLYIALMDARKAFDILWHLGLLREMHKTGFEGNNWLLVYGIDFKKVKWKGELSHQIIEQQGVRQGGIWSPSAYKLFVNSLLTTFEENQIGATIGSLYCGIPTTVADDVTPITTDPYELQTMLDIQSSFENKNRYEISEQMSVVLTFNDSSECNWHLNGKLMATPTSSTHLGIERDNTSNTGTKLVVKNGSLQQGEQYMH